MNRLTKLIVLLIMSMSVYFIYQKTNNSTINVINIGDGLSTGINSYGIKEYSHIDYYKDYLKNTYKKVKLNNNYSNKKLSINELLLIIKTDPTIKRELKDADIVFMTIGYNDLLFNMSIEEKIDDNKLNCILNEIDNQYNKLIKEIRKYYRKEIYLVGYPQFNKNDYYLNKGLIRLNSILRRENNTIFIDTNQELADRKLYFSNPDSYYPNREGYSKIFTAIKKYAEAYH